MCLLDSKELSTLSHEECGLLWLARVRGLQALHCLGYGQAGEEPLAAAALGEGRETRGAVRQAGSRAGRGGAVRFACAARGSAQ